MSHSTGQYVKRYAQTNENWRRGVTEQKGGKYFGIQLQRDFGKQLVTVVFMFPNRLFKIFSIQAQNLGSNDWYAYFTIPDNTAEIIISEKPGFIKELHYIVTKKVNLNPPINSLPTPVLRAEYLIVATGAYGKWGWIRKELIENIFDKIANWAGYSIQSIDNMDERIEIYIREEGTLPVAVLVAGVLGGLVLLGYITHQITITRLSSHQKDVLVEFEDSHQSDNKIKQTTLDMARDGIFDSDEVETIFDSVDDRAKEREANPPQLPGQPGGGGGDGNDTVKTLGIALIAAGLIAAVSGKIKL